MAPPYQHQGRTLLSSSRSCCSSVGTFAAGAGGVAGRGGKVARTGGAGGAGRTGTSAFTCRGGASFLEDLPHELGASRRPRESRKTALAAYNGVRYPCESHDSPNTKAKVKAPRKPNWSAAGDRNQAEEKISAKTGLLNLSFAHCCRPHVACSELAHFSQ